MPINPPKKPPNDARALAATGGPRSARDGGLVDRPSGVSSSQYGSGDHQTFFLGRYRVISEIGRGGMASVHLGRVDGPGGFHKWVAIKQIHQHLIDSDQFVDMFLDEARMAAGINHANVAHVFDIGKEGDGYWIAMEYLHGEPLRELMRHREEVVRQPVPATAAARICADAAEGLHAAHEIRGKNGDLLGLVHRDVTPHNLFVTYDGATKVVDFGIARATGRLSTTGHGQLKGKIAYMSPEQVRNQDIDRRTDIYALGIVLWELSTNQRLFRMDNDLDTLEKVFAGVVPRPSSIVRGYPPALEKIVMKALASDVASRYQTAREMSRDLHAFLAQSGAYVAWEDVSEVMKKAFPGELRKREEYLVWASDVTNTAMGKPIPKATDSLKPRRLHEIADDDSVLDEPSSLGDEDQEEPTVARDMLSAQKLAAAARRRPLPEPPPLAAPRRAPSTRPPPRSQKTPPPTPVQLTPETNEPSSNPGEEPTHVFDRKSAPPAPPARGGTLPGRTKPPPPPSRRPPPPIPAAGAPVSFTNAIAANGAPAPKPPPAQPTFREEAEMTVQFAPPPPPPAPPSMPQVPPPSGAAARPALPQSLASTQLSLANVRTLQQRRLVIGLAMLAGFLFLTLVVIAIARH